MVKLLSGIEVVSKCQVFLNINYIVSIEIADHDCIVSLVDGTKAYVTFAELEKIGIKFSIS